MRQADTLLPVGSRVMLLAPLSAATTVAATPVTRAVLTVLHISLRPVAHTPKAAAEKLSKLAKGSVIVLGRGPLPWRTQVDYMWAADTIMCDANLCAS